jgi:hypothetical protein
MTIRARSLTADGRPKMSEKLWQDRVIQLARWFKWKTAHFRTSLAKCKRCRGRVGLNPNCQFCKGKGLIYRTAVEGDGKGFLDTVLCRPPRLCFVELKVDGEKIKDKDQQDWFDLLSRCPGAETYVWHPADYDDVERILK